MAVKRIEMILGAVDQTQGPMKSARGGIDGLAASARALTGVLGAIGLGTLGRDIFNTSKEFQSLNASLITVTGSQNAANREFDRLAAFAAETPYQLDNIVGAYIKLKALGLDPSTEALRSYGNTASAMGKDLNQMIEAVADASVGEFERLKEFGIKARSEGDQVSFTFRGVSTTVRKEAGAIEGYLRRLGETDFAGGMDRQMETLGGAVSNLGDSWDQLMVAIGDTGPITAATSAINELAESLTNFGNSLKLYKAYQEGKISFWDFLTANPEDAKALLAQSSLIDSELSRLQQRVEDLKAHKQGNFWWSANEEAELQAAIRAVNDYRLALELAADAADSAAIPGAVVFNTAPTGDHDGPFQDFLAHEKNRARTTDTGVHTPPAVGFSLMNEGEGPGSGFSLTGEAMTVSDQFRLDSAVMLSEALAGFEDQRLASAIELESSITGVQEDEAARRLSVQALAAQNYGIMQQGIFTAAQGHSKKMMKLYQATQVPLALANAFQAAGGAMSDTPGPIWVRLAAYGAALGQGLVAYNTIRNLLGGGDSSGTSAPGYGGGTPGSPIVTQPQAALPAPERGQEINVHIYGNVMDNDKMARELTESLAKALRDGKEF